MNPRLELVLPSRLRSRKMNSRVKMRSRADLGTRSRHVITWAPWEGWLGLGSTLSSWKKNLPFVLKMAEYGRSSSFPGASKLKTVQGKGNHGSFTASGTEVPALQISLIWNNYPLYKCCHLGHICFNWQDHGLAYFHIFKQLTSKLSSGFASEKNS